MTPQQPTTDPEREKGLFEALAAMEASKVDSIPFYGLTEEGRERYRNEVMRYWPLIQEYIASQATATQERATGNIADIERLLLRWRFDDLQDKKALEIAEMLASLKKEEEL